MKSKPKISLVGKEVDYNMVVRGEVLEPVSVRAVVLEERRSYGRREVLIRLLDGKGVFWCAEANVTEVQK